MDTSTPPPAEEPGPDTQPAAAGPELPDDPRVPQPDDADPTVSKELGGAAPAIGPGRRRGT